MYLAHALKMLWILYIGAVLQRTKYDFTHLPDSKARPAAPEVADRGLRPREQRALRGKIHNVQRLTLLPHVLYIRPISIRLQTTIDINSRLRQPLIMGDIQKK